MKQLWQKLQAFFIGSSAALILRLLNSTLRWYRVGFDGANGRWPSENPRIIAFWHSRQLMGFWTYRSCCSKLSDRRAAALVSRHQDGRILAAGLKALGIDSVAGSSSRGGTEAIFQLAQAIQGGRHAAVSPDGPRGPEHKVKGGIIRVAQRTGTLIYPTAFSAQRKWVFNSWDKMILPKPFSKAVLVMGEAVEVPAALSNEEFTAKVQELEEKLNRVTAFADNYEYP